MNTIIQIYNSISIYIVAALSLLVIILLVMVSINMSAINKIETRYRRLTRGIENSNLQQVVEVYMDKIDGTKNDIEEIKLRTKELDDKFIKCLQKTAVMRYKAFDDVGSDLSFSLAMLDNDNDGVIITSIYGRNESTTYAKPIDKGISRYDLSDEENEVLEKAINS